MIIVKLMGGLGNQMFQYAVARRLAIQHGAELAFDLSYLEQTTQEDTPRKYELGNLAVKARVATPDEVAGLSGRYTGCWQQFRLALKRVAGGLPFRPCLVCERAGQFCNEVLSLPDNVYLQGFWQSERYFSDCREVIRQEFQVIDTPTSRNRELMERIAAVEAVFVHVRRGDYVNSAKTNAFHGVLPLSYYRRAVSDLCVRVSNPEFFIFSDDPGWVVEHLQLNLPTTYVAHNPPDQGHFDLQLMSLCRHAIIANSSFSWWGAWLIENRSKVVVAPERWFAVNDQQNPDMLPADWLQVPNE